MLASPNGKIYIGQTTRPIEKRIEEHRTGKSISCRALYNAIQYHGWENFEKDWYECPDEDLNFDEELLVREMGTLAPDGYNLKEGGGNGKLCEETKKKIGEAQRGEKNHNYGKTKSDETKRKMSESQRGEKGYMYGKTHTEESKQRMSESRCGEKNPNFGKTGEKHHNSKRVYQYDLDGNYIGSFGSTEEARRHLGKNEGPTIGKCARGDRKTAYGFKWSFELH